MKTKHATIELIEAMKGVHPSLEYNRDKARAVCDNSEDFGSPDQVFACHGARSGQQTDEDTDQINCPWCYRIYFDAMDPVRRDYLLEKGLIEAPTV